jgi:outer membrane receptor protein involved in Fe transport
MKKLILSLFFISNLNLIAQNNGKIAGHIIDGRSKEPLIGVNIVVKETNLGAVTNVNGSYFILNIPPGKYSVSASLVGFKTVVQENIIVNNGKTTKVDFILNETLMQTDEIIITGKAPDVQIDKTSTSENVRTDEVINTPGMKTLNDVISLSADVIDGHFRGGREGEELYNLQGMGIINPLTSGVAFTPIVSAIEEVEVITSGFSAQYGNAQSGVINITMKEGNNNKWTSFAEISSRLPGYKHWGGSVFEVDKNPYLQLLNSWEKWAGTDPITDSKFFDFISYGFSSQYRDSVQAAMIAFELWKQAKPDLNRQYNDLWDKSIELNIGGPLYSNVRLFLAGHFENVWASIPTHNPNFSRQLMGNIAIDLTKGMTLRLSGAFQDKKSTVFGGMSGSESGSTYYSDFRYWLWDRYFATASALEKNIQLGIRFSHAISHKTFYEFKLNSLSTQYKSGALLLDPNRFREDFSDRGTWRYFNTPDLFRIGYPENEFIDERTQTISLDGSLTSQVTESHMLLAGLQANYYKIDVNNNTGLSSPVQALDEKYNASPWEIALYLQDKMEYEGLIANVGIRVDIYNQNVEYYKDEYSPIRNPNYDPLQPPVGNNRYYAFELAAKELTPTVIGIQPRIGFSFPVSLNTVFHMNYGSFLQRPSFERTIFSRINRVDKSPIRLGNPRLKPQNTNSYDVGITQAIGEGFTIDLSGYYKDVSNLIERVFYIDKQQTFYETFANRDYADIRGFRVLIKKREGDFFTGSIRYNYSVATGKSSNPFNASPTYREDPQEGQEKIELPKGKDVLLDFDRTHNFLIQLSLKSPKEFGPEFFGVYPLERFNITFKSIIRSGRPYTYDASGLGELYNKRSPMEYNTDVRVTRSLPKWGNISATIYFEIFNLLNQKFYAYNTVFNNPDNVNKYENNREALIYYDEDPPFLVDQTFLIYGNAPRYFNLGIMFNL